MSNTSQGEHSTQREKAKCGLVGGCVCIELSADLSDLLTLSLYENNAECSRKSRGICTITTASYCMMTWRLNTQTKAIILYIYTHTHSNTHYTSDILVDIIKR